MKSFVIAIAALLLVTGCQPILLFPGGELDGSLEGAPLDWAFTDAIETIQLETRPSDPYSVNIWVIALDHKLYVHAGANRSTWVEHLEVDPQVRIRIREKIYKLIATRVEEATEFARFANAYEKKYDRRPRNENVAEAYLFRLSIPE